MYILYIYMYSLRNIPHNMNICDMMFSSPLVGFTRIDFTSKRQRFGLPDWLLGPRTPKMTLSQWIGLRQNLQETMVFTIKYVVFL